MQFRHHIPAPKQLLIGLLSLVSLASASVTELSVSSGGDIQMALDQCPATGGCVVRIAAGTYDLPNSLFLRNKQDIRITGGGAATRPVIRFQDDGTVAGPDSHPDTLAMKPKGWKHWPVDGTAQLGGATNTANPFSTSGILRNGTIVIQGCTNIVLDSLLIDGKAPIAWGSTKAWGGLYPTFYGNFGLNLYYSTAVTVKDCDIRNCFAGIFIKGAPYLLATQIPPNCNVRTCADSRDIAFTGKGGGHRFERNSIHHNIWATFKESNSGAPLTWRFNKIWENHNSSETYSSWIGATGKSPTYDRSNYAATPILATNTDAPLHNGGFFFSRDSSSKDTISNNTLWRNYRIVGFDAWIRPRFTFDNNIVAETWLDYNRDTTGFLTAAFTSKVALYEDVFYAGNLKSSTGTDLHANTFSEFPKIPYGTGAVKPEACTDLPDKCTALRANLRAQIWPTSRLSFMTLQVQGASFDVNGAKMYLTPLQNLSYIDAVQYQGQARITFTPLWTLESPSTVIPKVTYSSPLEAASLGKDMGFTETFTYKGLDSSIIATRFGRVNGLPDADTIGRIMGIDGSSTADSLLLNHYIKSISLVTDTTSPFFLSPAWSNNAVDSVIRGKAWAPAGQVRPAARGAVMPEVLTVGVAPRQSQLLHISVAVLRDGHLQFAKGTPDGICQILSVNGRQMANLDIQGGRSLQALPQRGLVVVRWKVGTSWQQASVLRP
jgi:hypothetical protein